MPLMTDSASGRDPRQTLWRIYDHIADNWYLGRQDWRINGRRCHSTLLLSLLTTLVQGRQLIIGEPGMGKTTGAEYVCALIFRLPLAIVWRAEVAGHPEQTEEKIIGRPDLGQLNQGREVVQWSFFTLLAPKIVDEINRLPETKQSLILDGVDRGKWCYLNDCVINDEFCFFATANYEDQGTGTIVPPLLDRFDLMVESRHPGPNLAYRIAAGTGGANGLHNGAITLQMERVLTAKTPYRRQFTQVEALCEQFGRQIAAFLGVPTLSRSARAAMREQFDGISVDQDANAFMRLVLAELSFCICHGQKRRHEPCQDGCHFTGYLCHDIRNCISNRFALSVQRYARALAWLTGATQADINHFKLILPHALAHRLQWSDQAIGRCEADQRADPLPIHLAKVAVAQMHRRYMEQSGRIKEALAVAWRIYQGQSLEPVQGDHPLFWEIRKDLGQDAVDPQPPPRTGLPPNDQSF
jgi:MoxR-like ATPase